jgi:hypothetical protein
MIVAGKMTIRICGYIADVMSNNTLTFWHVRALCSPCAATCMQFVQCSIANFVNHTLVAGCVDYNEHTLPFSFPLVRSSLFWSWVLILLSLIVFFIWPCHCSKILVTSPVKVKLAQFMPWALLGARDIALLIVTLGSGWRWVIIVMPQLLYTQERNPLYPQQMEVNFFQV